MRLLAGWFRDWQGLVDLLKMFLQPKAYYLRKYIMYELCSLFVHQLQIHHSKGTLRPSVEICNTCVLCETDFLLCKIIFKRDLGGTFLTFFSYTFLLHFYHCAKVIFSVTVLI